MERRGALSYACGSLDPVWVFFFIYILHVYIFTVCMHSCLLLHLHLSAFDLNEMHLDTYNFIMPCNNISLCDGKQAERGRTQRWDGGVGACMRVVFDIMLEWKECYVA